MTNGIKAKIIYRDGKQRRHSPNNHLPRQTSVPNFDFAILIKMNRPPDDSVFFMHTPSEDLFLFHLPCTYWLGRFKLVADCALLLPLALHRHRVDLHI